MLNTADARLAVLTAVAEEMFDDPTQLRPVADPRVSAMGYSIVGHLTAVDQLLDFGRERVYYGFVATGADGAVAIVRGTERAIEWAKDAEGLLLAHPVAGCVHAGFWNIYDSMRFLAADGAELPVVAGVLQAVPSGLPLVVAGHSLGAPLATYLGFDLADMRAVSGRFVASPRPGNGSFCDAASAKVPDHVAYAYADDIVPHVPFGFGYAELHRLVTLPHDPRVPHNPDSWHHARNYAWLLDPSVVPGGPV